MTAHRPDYRGSLPRPSGTSKNLPKAPGVASAALCPLSAALDAADRKPGWNNRPREVQMFELDSCTLYVVPFRRWAYRRQEQQTAACWRAQDTQEGLA